MSLVFLDGIGKRFANGTEALSDLSFVIEEGEFVSLLGPSGCGKSTALRLTCGLLAPDKGRIVWAAAKPEIGFVFQDPTLMPWADALANVRLPLDLRRMGRRAANERACQALARVGLAGFESSYPRELSGGMRMRVSIARALASQPALLLLDEPFAALDEITRMALCDDLLRLWAEEKLSVLFVTHSVSESSYLSSRVLVMSPRPGHIVGEIVMPAGARERLSQESLLAQRSISAALKKAMAK